MSNTEKKDYYTLQEVTYAFLTEKVHDPAFIEVSFTDIKSNNGVTDELATSFKSQCNTFSQYLRKILDILGVKDEFENCRKNNEYSFDTEDKNFLTELMFKYTYKKCFNHQIDKKDPEVKIWKAIRQIDNDGYDGFIDIYATQIGYPLINELIFIKEGFLNFYKKHVRENSLEYDEFERKISIGLQYNRILWMRQVDCILSDALPLQWDEIEASKGAALLYDYEVELENFMRIMQAVVEIENTVWQDKKNIRKHECKELSKDDSWRSALLEATAELERIKNHLPEDEEVMQSDSCSQEKKVRAKERKRKEQKDYNTTRKALKEHLRQLLTQEDGEKLIRALERTEFVSPKSDEIIEYELIDQITELRF